MSLQDMINLQPDNGRLDLPPGEFFGQVTIDCPITIVGKGKSTWIGARTSPTIKITSPGVKFQNLMVETTAGTDRIAIQAAPGTNPVLEDVIVRGRTEGVRNDDIHFTQGAPRDDAVRISFAPPPPAPKAMTEPLAVSSEQTSGQRPASVAGPTTTLRRKLKSSTPAKILALASGMALIVICLLVLFMNGKLEQEKKADAPAKVKPAPVASAVTPPTKPALTTASVLIRTIPDGVKVHLGPTYAGESGKDGLLIVDKVKVATDHDFKFEKTGFDPKKVSIRIPKSHAGRVYRADEIHLNKEEHEQKKSSRIPGLRWVAKRVYFTESHIVTDGGLIFTISQVNGSHPLNAIDLATGRVVWSREDAWSSAIVAGDGMVFHHIDGHEGAQFCGTEIKTRRQKWCFPDLSNAEHPTYGGGIICFPDGYGDLIALDAQNGRIRWKLKAEYGVSQPTIANDMVFFGDPPNLHAVDLNTGRRKWKQPGYFYHPYADGSTLCAMDQTNSVAAFDTRTGRRKWRLKGIAGTPPVASDGIVCFGGGRPSDPGWVLYGVQAETGRTAWKTPLEKEPYFYGLAAADGVVFAPCKDGLHAFDIKTGKRMWSVKVNCYMSRHPLVKDGIIYFGTFDGDLYAVDIKKAEQEYGQ